MAPPAAVPEITTTRQPETRTEPKITTTLKPSSESVTIPVVEITTAAAAATQDEVTIETTTTNVVLETTTTEEAASVTEAVVTATTTTEDSVVMATTTIKQDEDNTVTKTVEDNAVTKKDNKNTVTVMSTTQGDVFVAITTESEAELLPTTTTPKTTENPTTTQEILQAVRTMSSANLASGSNLTGKIEMITAINIQTQTKITDNDDDNNSNVNNTKRNQRSIIDYLIARYYDDYYIPKKYNFPKFRPRIPFFLDGGIHRIDRTFFMTYDTILPFFYMPNLDAVALSFPLDSSHYYLLLILPLREDGIDDLICDLKRSPDLKYIIRNMKYTHVKAIIPSFTLRGHVNLTPSLQRVSSNHFFLLFDSITLSHFSLEFGKFSNHIMQTSHQ